MTGDVPQAGPAGDGAMMGDCEPPVLHDWLVPRPALVERLTATDPVGVVVAAPAGYGKSSLVAQWELASEQVFAWVRLSPDDADPRSLGTHVARALAVLAPLGEDLRHVLDAPDRTVATLFAALADEFAARQPAVIVLDGVHVLGAASRSTVGQLLGVLPEGWRFVLVTRRADPLPPLGLGHLDHGSLITHDELAMDGPETRQLLAAQGVTLGDAALADLVARTEGWPAGLHLAASTMTGAGAGRAIPGPGFDVLVRDYLEEQVLGGLPEELVRFLEDSSVLDEMTAVHLDLLLETDQSATHLRNAGGHLGALLVTVDPDAGVHRYHRPLRDTLRAQQHQHRPARMQSLHRRASTLLEGAGDTDAAVRHALRAGDRRRAGGLVLARALPLAASGELDQLGAWVALFGPSAVDEVPEVAVAAAWWGATAGEAEMTARAIRSARGMDGDQPLGDGTPSLEVALAAVQAMAPAAGVDQLLIDCGTVRDAGGPATNPWWGLATLLEGTAHSMRGRQELAESRLRDALDGLADMAGFEALALAHLALLALERDEPVESARLELRATGIARRNGLDQVVAAVPVFTIGALVAARGGRFDEAAAASSTAARLLSRMGDLSPPTSLCGYLLLAESAAERGQRHLASDWAEEAQRARRRDASATHFVERLDRLRDVLDARIDLDAAPAHQRITPAEHRVLALLPTHLSLQGIADEVMISRNTAKSHSIAIYRKLGVSSRSDAVQAADELGLLDRDPRSIPTTQPR